MLGYTILYNDNDFVLKYITNNYPVANYSPITVNNGHKISALVDDCFNYGVLSSGILLLLLCSQ